MPWGFFGKSHICTVHFEFVIQIDTKCCKKSRKLSLRERELKKGVQLVYIFVLSREVSLTFSEGRSECYVSLLLTLEKE